MLRARGGESDNLKISETFQGSRAHHLLGDYIDEVLAGYGYTPDDFQRLAPVTPFGSLRCCCENLCLSAQ